MSGQSTTERAQRNTRLNIRATAQQQQVIRRAAASLDRSVTDFVLESATTNAQRVLADRRLFVLTEDAWDEFETLLDSPDADAPKLRALLTEPTIFDTSE